MGEFKNLLNTYFPQLAKLKASSAIHLLHPCLIILPISLKNLINNKIDILNISNNPLFLKKNTYRIGRKICGNRTSTSFKLHSRLSNSKTK
ncbi:hypothetical protein B1B01_07245 [Priestia filamentosa]|nr:hypothetical protein B1B01_07245 [Priestia filamentosa]